MATRYFTMVRKNAPKMKFSPFGRRPFQTATITHRKNSNMHNAIQKSALVHTTIHMYILVQTQAWQALIELPRTYRGVLIANSHTCQYNANAIVLMWKRNRFQVSGATR